MFKNISAEQLTQMQQVQVFFHYSDCRNISGQITYSPPIMVNILEGGELFFLGGYNGKRS